MFAHSLLLDNVKVKVQAYTIPYFVTLHKTGAVNMSKLYENITNLCQERGISGYKLCRELSIQPSTLTDLKMGRKTGLSATNASKIAQYFGVSVGYLLGTQEDKEELDDFTYAMYRETRDLSEESRQTLLQMARFLRQQEK